MPISVGAENFANNKPSLGITKELFLQIRAFTAHFRGIFVVY